jgi:hypothetical protein
VPGYAAPAHAHEVLKEEIKQLTEEIKQRNDVEIKQLQQPTMRRSSSSRRRRSSSSRM